MITRRALFSLDFDRPPHAAGALLRVHRTAMACRVEVALAEEDGRDVAAARAALDEADRVERLLTVFRESSEVSRINREASGGAAAVDAEVYALLSRCRHLHAATGGAFDITSTPLSRCWGFLKRKGQVPPDADIETARALVGMGRVDFDDEALSIRFARAGMQLNLNAVGKGYALDRMARVLRKDGVRHALLSAGGSSVVAVGGRRGGWPIDIRSPLVSRSPIARLRLHDGAMGTSGPGEQFVIAGGTRYGHVIDPRTGRPARGVLSASVVGADGATADALSTAFFVGGCELAASYCAAHPDTLALLTLDDQGQTTLRFGQFAGCDVTEPRT